MTSPQHAQWIRSGRQWQLARPLLVLRDRLRGYGYTVYDLGDTGHLDRIPPEDHTPYSETGWPGATPYGWVTAIDVMPPSSTQPRTGLPSLQSLGGQLFADRQAGVPAARWLKYMNWGPADDRHAVHDRWEPGHQRSMSDDAGHIHLSCRSDVTSAKYGDAYDPIARLRGLDNPVIITVEDSMPFVAKSNTGQYYVCDLITSRPVPPEAVKDVLYLAKQLNYGHGSEGGEWTDGGWTRVGWTEAAFGTVRVLDTPTPGATPTFSGEVTVSGTLTVQPH